MNNEDIDYGDIEEDYIIGDFNKPTYEELQQRIDKAIDFIDNWEKYKKDKGSLEVSMLDLLYIKEILGGDDNGM